MDLKKILMIIFLLLTLSLIGLGIFYSQSETINIAPGDSETTMEIQFS